MVSQAKLSIIQKSFCLGSLILFVALLPQKGLVQSSEDILREGTILFNDGKYEKAEELYRRLISLYPNYELAYERLGDSLYLQSKVRDANEIYKKLLQINPNSRSAYYGIQDTETRTNALKNDQLKNFDQVMQLF